MRRGLLLCGHFARVSLGGPVFDLKKLRQNGTGVVRTVDDETSYYRLPDRTAVIDPLFNGNRVLSPEVYRNRRLRERPLVNSSWELVINKRDEKVNEDIDLQSLSDIRLYVYYTDFTAI